MPTPRSDVARPPAVRWLLVEAIVITALFWADNHHWRHVVVLSKTPYLLVLGWISLRVRGQTWRSVGMRSPISWPRAIAFGLAAGCAMEALELYLTQPLRIRVFHQPPDLSALARLHGDAEMLAVALLFT